MSSKSFCEIGCATGTDKCHHHRYHIPYERHFHHLRDKCFTLLEIGVQTGASLRLWEEYFPKAKIFAIDIDPACQMVAQKSTVFIGDQSNPEFLSRVIKEAQGFDVVIDDGSHIMNHQQISFQTLFPHVRDGGFYVIEDLETSYYTFANYGGGPVGKLGTTVALVKSFIDDLNTQYHGGAPISSARISGIHLYKNIVFIAHD